jgi:VWFA-related protein
MGPFLGLAVLVLALLGQQIVEEAFVINIEVPVRVYQGNRFIENLGLADFELYEDGRPQKVEALYFVKKHTVERRDEVRSFTPQTNRNFYLFFEISGYTAKLGEALDYFIQNVFMPGDSLTVVSPMKTYRLKPHALEARTRAQIADQIRGLLRQDAGIGSAEYNNIISDLEDLSRAIVFAMSRQLNAVGDNLQEEITVTEYLDISLEELLIKYTQALRRLESVRSADEQQLLNFSRVLRADQGQKLVYLFYEREFVPRIDPKVLVIYADSLASRPDIRQSIADLFEFYKREPLLDIKRLKEAYADAAIAIHFLFVTTPTKITPELQYQEQSDDIFSAFREMAEATGGFTESSQNPVVLLKDAVQASDNYYLLYYTPRPYLKDSKFHRITVKLKNADYQVVHRIGYYAD